MSNTVVALSTLVILSILYGLGYGSIAFADRIKRRNNESKAMRMITYVFILFIALTEIGAWAAWIHFLPSEVTDSMTTFWYAVAGVVTVVVGMHDKASRIREDTLVTSFSEQQACADDNPDAPVS